LALSNWWVVRENYRLRQELNSSESFQHTAVGVKLPPLYGQGLDGRDLSIAWPAGNQETLVLAFSPSCGHCKKTWPAWLELARGCEGKRVVFANVGGSLSEFLKKYQVGNAVLFAHVEPASILAYHFHETPITLLLTPDGRSKNVWTGEIPAARLEEIKKDVGWRR
jgi:thiol-disulfide isomerase/thioredoxin